MSALYTQPFYDTPIKNFSFEQFFDTFHSNEINLSSFWLMNVGIVKEERRFAHIILRACQIRPLFGPHLVSVFYSKDNEPPEMKTFWVHSLTYLRRNLFQFEDRLSFERSTYVIPFQDGSLLVRLKSIRAFIYLPYGSPNTGTQLETISERERTEKDQSEECTEKMKSLLNHHLQCMISYLNREMQIPSEVSIGFLHTYIQEYFENLKNKISTPHGN